MYAAICSQWFRANYVTVSFKSSLEINTTHTRSEIVVLFFNFFVALWEQLVFLRLHKADGIIWIMDADNSRGILDVIVGTNYCRGHLRGIIRLSILTVTALSTLIRAGCHRPFLVVLSDNLVFLLVENSSPFLSWETTAATGKYVCSLYVYILSHQLDPVLLQNATVYVHPSKAIAREKIGDVCMSFFPNKNWGRFACLFFLTRSTGTSLVVAIVVNNNSDNDNGNRPVKYDYPIDECSYRKWSCVVSRKI